METRWFGNQRVAPRGDALEAKVGLTTQTAGSQPLRKEGAPRAKRGGLRLPPFYYFLLVFFFNTPIIQINHVPLGVADLK